MSAPTDLDLIGLLFRRWRVIVLCAVLGSGVGLAYGFIAPPWFMARLTVVASQRTSTHALSMIANLPGADMLPGAGATDVQRIQAVLDSASVGDEVISKFKLADRYDTSYIEETRDELTRHCNTSSDRKSGVVTLTCEDRDPHEAMAMAAYFGEVGNSVFGRISVSSAREERAFLERQVVKTRNDVDEASRKLREFQEQHRVVDLGEQSKAVISAMASVEGQLVTKQLELSYLTSFSSATEANVIQLQQQIAIMEAKLKQLELSRDKRVPAVGSGSAAEPDSKFFPDAMRVPALRFELEQLLRQQKVQETVFFLLTQRYETAKVDEARDTSTFQILDSPTLPTHKSRPRRVRIAILGLSSGLVFAGAWIILSAWWRRRRVAVAIG